MLLPPAGGFLVVEDIPPNFFLLHKEIIARDYLSRKDILRFWSSLAVSLLAALSTMFSRSNVLPEKA